MSSFSSSFAPQAAWLKKRTWTMGRARWQARFFVLLETELRYYKDEHATLPSIIFSLQDIDHVRRIRISGQAFCLSFESARLHKVLAFSSEIEMNEWHEHIRSRLNRRHRQVTPPSSLVRHRGVLLASVETDQDYDQDHMSSMSVSSLSSSSSSLASSSTLPGLIVVDPPHKLDRESASSPSFLHYMYTFRL